MLDKMDTYNWETPQECLPSGCNECDLSGTFNKIVQGESVGYNMNCMVYASIAKGP